jgi:hypothetical protein
MRRRRGILVRKGPGQFGYKAVSVGQDVIHFAAQDELKIQRTESNGRWEPEWGAVLYIFSPPTSHVGSGGVYLTSVSGSSRDSNKPAMGESIQSLKPVEKITAV